MQSAASEAEGERPALSWSVVSADAAQCIEWNARTSVQHSTFTGLSSASPHSLCCFGPSSRYLTAAHSSKALLMMWDRSAAAVPMLRCPVPEVLTCLAVVESARGHIAPLLVAGAASGNIHVWHLGSGALIRSFEAHYKEVNCIAVLSDCSFIVSGGGDGVVHLWSLGALLDVKRTAVAAQHSMNSHGLSVTALYSALGSYNNGLLASASLDNTLKLWALPSGRLVSDVLFPSAVSAVVMDDNGLHIFAGSVTGSIYLISINEGHVAPHATVESSHEEQFAGHSGEITSLALITNDVRLLLVSASRDATVRVWDVASRQCLSVFAAHESSVLNMAVVAQEDAASKQGQGKRDAWVPAKLDKYKLQREGEAKASFWRIYSRPAAVSPAHLALELAEQALQPLAIPHHQAGDNAPQQQQDSADAVQLRQELAKWKALCAELYEFNVKSVGQEKRARAAPEAGASSKKKKKTRSKRQQKRMRSNSKKKQ